MWGLLPKMGNKNTRRKSPVIHLTNNLILPANIFADFTIRNAENALSAA
jgi:hypothetical protein